jgi:hypothetical protein
MRLDSPAEALPSPCEAVPTAPTIAGGNIGRLWARPAHPTLPSSSRTMNSSCASGLLAERYFARGPQHLPAEAAAAHRSCWPSRWPARVGLYTGPDEKQVDLLRRLQDEGIVPREVSTLFHEVRRSGNEANHQLTGDHRSALMALRFSWQLGVWFHRTFQDPGVQVRPLRTTRFAGRRECRAGRARVGSPAQRTGHSSRPPTSDGGQHAWPSHQAQAQTGRRRQRLLGIDGG